MRDTIWDGLNVLVVLLWLLKYREKANKYLQIAT